MADGALHGRCIFIASGPMNGAATTSVKVWKLEESQRLVLALRSRFPRG